MTDLRIALTILVMCLIIGALVNVSLLVSVGSQWRLAIRSKSNGPRFVVVRGTVRRILIRLILQLALIVQFGTRLAGEGPASPGQTAWVVLILVLALSVDAMGDMFDLRLLRWQLRDKGE